MYMFNIKKDGKTVFKGWHSKPEELIRELEIKWDANRWDEITIRKPAVAVLPTQAELEASGKKD